MASFAADYDRRAIPDDMVLGGNKRGARGVRRDVELFRNGELFARFHTVSEAEAKTRNVERYTGVAETGWEIR